MCCAKCYHTGVSSLLVRVTIYIFAVYRFRWTLTHLRLYQVSKTSCEPTNPGAEKGRNLSLVEARGRSGAEWVHSGLLTYRSKTAKVSIVEEEQIEALSCEMFCQKRERRWKINEQ